MSQKEKTIDLNEYIKKMRTNLLLLLESNKETALKVFDEMSANLYKAYGELEVLKKQIPRNEEKPAKAALKKKKK